MFTMTAHVWYMDSIASGPQIWLTLKGLAFIFPWIIEKIEKTKATEEGFLSSGPWLTLSAEVWKWSQGCWSQILPAKFVGCNCHISIFHFPFVKVLHWYICQNVTNLQKISEFCFAYLALTAWVSLSLGTQMSEKLQNTAIPFCSICTMTCLVLTVEIPKFCQKFCCLPRTFAFFTDHQIGAHLNEIHENTEFTIKKIASLPALAKKFAWQDTLMVMSDLWLYNKIQTWCFQTEWLAVDTIIVSILMQKSGCKFKF